MLLKIMDERFKQMLSSFAMPNCYILCIHHLAPIHSIRDDELKCILIPSTIHPLGPKPPGLGISSATDLFSCLSVRVLVSSFIKSVLQLLRHDINNVSFKYTHTYNTRKQNVIHRSEYATHEDNKFGKII